MSYDLEIRKADPKKLAAFYRELIKRYPELDEDNDDESPWSATLDRSPTAMALPMSFSWTSEVVPFVLALAGKHGLHVHDPQTKKLHAPNPKLALPAKPKKPKLPTGVIYEREKSGLVQRVILREWTRKEVRMSVRITHADIGSAIAKAVGTTTEVPLVDCPVDELWRDADGGLRIAQSKRPHDIFLATNKAGITRDLKKFVLPLLRRLDSLKKLTAIYAAKDNILARYLVLPARLDGVDGRIEIWMLVGAALTGDMKLWRAHSAMWTDKKMRAQTLALATKAMKAVQKLAL